MSSDNEAFHSRLCSSDHRHLQWSRCRRRQISRRVRAGVLYGHAVPRAVRAVPGGVRASRPPEQARAGPGCPVGQRRPGRVRFRLRETDVGRGREEPPVAGGRRGAGLPRDHARQRGPAEAVGQGDEADGAAAEPPVRLAPRQHPDLGQRLAHRRDDVPRRPLPVRQPGRAGGHQEEGARGIPGHKQRPGPREPTQH